MPRSGANAHRHLQSAALELFLENGYEQTTAAEIAARAGVTERTFFRHFADKRDILFDGDYDLKSMLTKLVREAPSDRSPMQVLLHAFHAVTKLFQDNRDFIEPRHQIIEAHAALKERELSKMAAITTGLVSSLEQRGCDAAQATLAAQVGTTSFHHALAAWIEYPDISLDIHLDRTFKNLQMLSSGLDL